MLRDSDMVVKACKENLGIGMGETTADKLFTVCEVYLVFYLLFLFFYLYFFIYLFEVNKLHVRISKARSPNRIKLNESIIFNHSKNLE